ncbi:MAG: hypothetical protein WCY48_06400 [Candidatus Caldatribacteriota bacterium]
MPKWFLSLIILCMCSVASSTTFMRVSVDNQIIEADSIFIGHFLEQKSVQVEDGQIATQMVFQLSKEYGLNSDFFGLTDILIHYPGGTWDGRTVYIDGVPSFTPGEKVAILAKNIDNRLWGLNLALGSYRIVNYGNETLLLNDIFPNDPLVSQIKIGDFENKVKNLKGSSLKIVRTPDLLLDQNDQGKNRSIASIASPEENKVEDSARPSNFWLLFFFALLGGIASYRMRTAGRSRGK